MVAIQAARLAGSAAGQEAAVQDAQPLAAVGLDDLNRPPVVVRMRRT
jgi:hypothetical protein